MDGFNEIYTDFIMPLYFFNLHDQIDDAAISLTKILPRVRSWDCFLVQMAHNRQRFSVKFILGIKGVVTHPVDEIVTNGLIQ